MDRGSLDVETLLKLVLVLVVVWIAVEILSEVVGLFLGVFGFLRPVIGLVIVALIVLWLLDRI